jgi:inhibitor of cysteine peptidase
MPGKEIKIRDFSNAVEANPDDIVVVSLPENPSTGYRWTTDQVGDPVLTLEDSGFSQSADMRIGEGGTRTFRFKARGAGTTRLRLVLRRQWESERSNIDQREIQVSVRPQSGSH